jgi:hypothetical protein
MEDSKRIFFVQKISEGEFETESIWCKQLGNNKFLIDNIPFIAKRISLGDIILAELDEDDNQYYFDDFVSTSGNSTVRIFTFSNEKIEDIRKWLDNKTCESEVLLSKGIIAVNIPKEIVYAPIKEFLEDGENKGKWTYEESCLEHEY